MLRNASLALFAGASCLCAANNEAAAFDRTPREPNGIYVQEPQASVPVRTASAERSNLGGGFIEFLFGDPHVQGRYRPQQQPVYQQQPSYSYEQQPAYQPQGLLAPLLHQAMRPDAYADPMQRPFDSRYEIQEVEYHGDEKSGTIVIDTSNKFLYLVEGGGRALRYGIGVGRPGFTWSGVKTISAKREWPDWTPPPEMLARRPDLPRHMEGGPENPLGARAMYLGSSLYRIHGSNEPWTIGTNVSSGCIRMRNEDVIDLYDRVNVGTRVVVL
jgi:lipoprotein-anchoring transpeptidase ErfK/SrfK